VSFDDLLGDLARTLAVPDSTADEAREAYLRACRQLEQIPAEQRRIDDIADLLDTEETLYAQARAAADRGDTATAIALLRKCAEAGTGEAAWLLAQLLEDTGSTAEATIWYQRASEDGDARADEILAALRLRPPLADLPGSPQEHGAAASDRTAPVIFVSHSSELRTWTDRERLSAGASQAASAHRELLDWFVLAAPHHGSAAAERLFKASFLQVGFSCPDSDHLASFADTLRAAGDTRNCLVHDNSWVKTRLVVKLTKMLQARDPALVTEWALPSLLLLSWGPDEPGKSRPAAQWALGRRLDYENYSRPCPANLARLYAAGQDDSQWPARQPVVTEVMLPPSEVPACSPGTTVAQALELLVQSRTQALPVCETVRVTGIVTLTDLARHISSHQGVPSVSETIRALMRPAAIVPPGTPLPAIAKAIAEDGIIVVSGSGDQPEGYLTSESLLTQSPPGRSTRPASLGRPPLLIPGAGAVLLNRSS
jgi:CBS domain-containing protein/TPR repeat protein